MNESVSDIDRLKKENEELKKINSLFKKSIEYKNKFSLIMDSISDFVVITDTQGKIEFVNSALLKRLGYTFEELIGQTAHILISPKNSPEFVSKIYNATLQGSWSGDVLNISKNGEEFWASVDTTLLIQDGKAVGLSSISRDISERKRSEEKLKKSEEKYQSVVNNVKEVIFQTDADGLWTFLNPAWEEITGFTLDESIGQNFLNYVHPDDRQKNYEKFVPLIERKKEYCRHVIRYLTKDGGFRWIEVFARLTLDDEDKIIGTTGTLSDITDRVIAEEEIIKSKAQLNAILDNIPLLSWLKNDSLRYIAVNEPFASSLHLKADDIVGMTDLEIFPESIAIKNIEDDLEVIKAGKHKFVELPIIIDGETKQWVESFKTPIFNENGEVIGITGLERDITERKKSEEELKKAREVADKANRAKSIFLANMSHEIRTPMNAILGFAELLKNQISDKKQKDYLNGISISGNNLLRLINDILDLSKIEAGKIDIQNETVNVFSLLSEIRQIFSLKILEKELSFSIDIAQELPHYLFLDEMRLRQIFLNLVGNSIKFTNRGSVTVKIYCDNIDNLKNTLNLYIEVIDTGIGIAKDEQSSIFEAFKQQEGQSTRKYGGTGLGLTITKRLVELMNGNIFIESEVGRGTTFKLKFTEIKIASEKNKKQQIVGAFTDYVKFTKVKILLADDNEYNNIVVQGFLEEQDIKFIVAENGREAVELAEKEKPDLILMDIQMPELNGYEATKKIKKIEHLKRTPIVALTASVMYEDKEKIKKIFDGYIRKPVSKRVIINELIKFLPYTIEKNIDNNLNGNKTSEDVIAEININEFKFDEKIKKSLSDMFYKRWKEIQDGMFIDDIATFATDLNKFGARNKLENIEKISDILYSACESFDIEKITRLLKLFPKIIGK